MNDKTTTTLERALDIISSPPGQVILAGIVGGLIRWITTEKTVRGGLAAMAAGLAAAWYLGPAAAALVSDVFNVAPDNLGLLGAVAFTVGLGGVSIVALIVATFRSINNASVVRGVVSLIGDFMRFKFGGGPKP